MHAYEVHACVHEVHTHEMHAHKIHTGMRCGDVVPPNGSGTY
jgi:hypothetical protein